MSNVIDKIRLSGVTYTLSATSAGGSPTVELTQAEYDALVSAGTVSADTYYIISDAPAVDISNYWTSAQTQSAITQSVSGKADTSAVTSVSDSLTSHTANTTVHVTASEKSTWNSKSDFSGNYNDLSNKPTIPTSASQLTNDSGYITSSALNGYATEDYVTAATNDMATKTWVGQQGYLTQHQDISGKQDVSGMTAYTTTATTNTLSGTVTAHTADTTIHVTASEKSTWNAKSDFSGDYNDLTNKLSAGTNITIVDNVISATGGGGGGVNVVQTTGTSTTDVMSQDAVTTQLNGKGDAISLDMVTSPQKKVTFQMKRGGTNGTTISSRDLPLGRGLVYGEEGFDTLSTSGLVETTAITTSISSSSTDSQVPSAKAVYDALGSASGGISSAECQSMIDSSISGKADSSSLATVATSGSYNDLDNKPTIPTVPTNVSDFTNDAGYTTSGYVDSAVSGKADSSAVTQVNNALTGHTADTTIHVTTAQTAAWDAKQNALTIDSTVTSGSTNPVQGGAVYTQLGGLKLQQITQSAYDGLTTYDSNTLYVIVN